MGIGADPGTPGHRREGCRRGQRVAPWSTKAAHIGEVVVEVQEDRARDVAGVVGRTAIARPIEIPAHVDDAQVGIVDAVGELCDGDERHWWSMG